MTDEQAALVAELNDCINPLSGSLPQLNHDDLLVFDFLSSKKIVGLGEATHGTREFFEMKHRLFQYLVEEHGFRVFAFEVDFAESIYIDRYITTGEGDLHQLMLEKTYFWIWRTESVKALFQWMRSFNQDRTLDDMIRYVGVDCQSTIFQGELLIEFFYKVSPEFAQQYAPLLENMREWKLNRYYEEMTESEYDSIRSELTAFYDAFTENKTAFAQSSSIKEVEQAEHLITTLMQAHQVGYQNYHAAWNLTMRDRYMAENTRWILSYLGDGVKIALWAHNYHVAANASYTVTGSLGFNLKQTFGEQYYPIGFGFTKGSFMAWNEGRNRCSIDSEPLRDSYNFIFHHAESDAFIINFEDIPEENGLWTWLSQYRLFLSIGAVYNGIVQDYYYEMSMTNHFGTLIYFDETNASVLLE